MQAGQRVAHRPLASSLQPLPQSPCLHHHASQALGGGAGPRLRLLVTLALHAQVLADVGFDGREPGPHRLLEGVQVPGLLDRDAHRRDLVPHLLAQRLAAVLGGRAVGLGA
jgi:hypothetical protein